MGNPSTSSITFNHAVHMFAIETNYNNLPCGTPVSCRCPTVMCPITTSASRVSDIGLAAYRRFLRGCHSSSSLFVLYRCGPGRRLHVGSTTHPLPGKLAAMLREGHFGCCGDAVSLPPYHAVVYGRRFVSRRRAFRTRCRGMVILHHPLCSAGIEPASPWLRCQGLYPLSYKRIEEAALFPERPVICCRYRGGDDPAGRQFHSSISPHDFMLQV